MIQRGTKCALCKKKRPGIKLIQTKCCYEWICDDEHTYKLFSYDLNSCSRNHFRYSSCSYHFRQGHEGELLDCTQCRGLDYLFNINDQRLDKSINAKTKSNTQVLEESKASVSSTNSVKTESKPLNTVRKI